MPAGRVGRDEKRADGSTGKLQVRSGHGRRMRTLSIRPALGGVGPVHLRSYRGGTHAQLNRSMRYIPLFQATMHLKLGQFVRVADRIDVFGSSTYAWLGVLG